MERYNPPPRRSGGIGRRSGLKIRRPQKRVGSSPTSGTSEFKGMGESLTHCVWGAGARFRLIADAGQ
jgi:hypothetical protein